MSNLERRTFTEEVQFRAEGKSLIASGYAYVFGKRSQNLGNFVEQIATGAGKKSLQEQDVRALYNHDPNWVLGRMGSGTLRMQEDAHGGAYEIDLPDTHAGRDVATLLERRDIIGSSFGFRTISDEWGETETGFMERTLTEFSLRDVGPVTFPAYTDATAALRCVSEKRSLDLDLLVAASEAGELRALILPHDAAEEEALRLAEQGRATPTFYRVGIAGLLAS